MESLKTDLADTMDAETIASTDSRFKEIAIVTGPVSLLLPSLVTMIVGPTSPALWLPTSNIP